MIREEIIGVWNGLKTKNSQLKAKSIDNYEIITKRAILALTNSRSKYPLNLCNFVVSSGEVTVLQDKFPLQSEYVTEVTTQLLKVAVLEYIDEEDPFLKNYEAELI